MLYRELNPAPALRPYVRCYWILRADETADTSPQRVLPDGCVEIIINLGARFIRHDESGRLERQPRELVVGPTTRHMTIASTGAIRLVCGVEYTLHQKAVGECRGVLNRHSTCGKRVDDIRCEYGETARESGVGNAGYGIAKIDADFFPVVIALLRKENLTACIDR